jgi:hypothetical protein
MIEDDQRSRSRVHAACLHRLMPASEERTKRAVDQALREERWSTARRAVHQMCTEAL